MKEFDDCKKRNKLTAFPDAKNFVAKEIEQARSDLATAKISLLDKNHKWATIQCYYSMFHTARSLIYVHGLREKSHYCLIIAIRSIYVETRLLDYKHVESLQLAKNLRENADYYGNFSEEIATQLITSAEEFLKATSQLLK